jgi:hypothetical protein
MIKYGLILCLLFVSLSGFARDKKATREVNEKFKHLKNWVVEQVPGGEVSIKNGQLDIDDFSGCTIWYKHELEAPLVIEYEATVVDEGGKNDRVSDLNCFWLAKDLNAPDDFFEDSKKRGGKFQNYHNLSLYYVGLGGHNNTKTRFRKYMGNGDRPILPEHDLADPKFLIEANKCNRIKIVVDGSSVRYYFNGTVVYDVEDEEPYEKGYFGFRTYKNHMRIDNFKVYKPN